MHPSFALNGIPAIHVMAGLQKLRDSFTTSEMSLRGRQKGTVKMVLRTKSPSSGGVEFEEWTKPENPSPWSFRSFMLYAAELAMFVLHFVVYNTSLKRIDSGAEFLAELPLVSSFPALQQALGDATYLTLFAFFGAAITVVVPIIFWNRLVDLIWTVNYAGHFRKTTWNAASKMSLFIVLFVGLVVCTILFVEYLLLAERIKEDPIRGIITGEPPDDPMIGSAFAVILVSMNLILAWFTSGGGRVIRALNVITTSERN
ncbi:MAG: hypothetical protein AAF296_03005 [Pseudomonadota bacterium]